MTVIDELPPVEIPGHVASGLGSDDHPMRIMTRRAAGLAPGGWDAEARDRVESYFDELAREWQTRTSPERTAVVVDALDRGGVVGQRGVAIEIGSGIGTYSALLAERFATVAAIDISLEMLRLAPATPPRIQADAADLPFRAACADAVVLVNALLFPAEVDRLLAPAGQVVWVNSSGEQTPIHLTATEVAHTLPGEWRGTASRAGHGSWCVLRRA